LPAGVSAGAPSSIGRVVDRAASLPALRSAVTVGRLLLSRNDHEKRGRDQAAEREAEPSDRWSDLIKHNIDSVVHRDWPSGDLVESVVSRSR
jgi:hypothetical protein